MLYKLTTPDYLPCSRLHSSQVFMQRNLARTWKKGYIQFIKDDFGIDPESIV